MPMEDYTFDEFDYFVQLEVQERIDVNYKSRYPNAPVLEWYESGLTVNEAADRVVEYLEQPYL